MKKLIALSVISLILAGCVNPGKASVQPEQLQNHRFVLENVDGKAVKTTTTQPEISFSASFVRQSPNFAQASSRSFIIRSRSFGPL